MKGLDVGYGVLCHRFDMRLAGSINNSTGVDGVLGSKSCNKQAEATIGASVTFFDQPCVHFIADSRYAQASASVALPPHFPLRGGKRNR
jgi:hypothetical protein